MVLLEFLQQGIQGAQVVGGGVRVEVENGGEAEAEEEVVGCAAGLVARA